MSEIKKVPNNIKGRRKGSGATMVDPQILRRRAMLKKKGILLGRASKQRAKVSAKQREERAQPDPTKKKFF